MKKRNKYRNVAILVNKEITAKKILEELGTHNIIIIKIEGIELIVIGVYMASSIHQQTYMRLLAILETFFNVSEAIPRVFITGEFDINLNNKSEFKKLMKDIKLPKMVLKKLIRERTFLRSENLGHLDFAII